MVAETLRGGVSLALRVLVLIKQMMSIDENSRGRILLAVVATAVLICACCSTSPQAKETKHLHKGAALLAKKDYARALLEFQNAAEAMPKDAEPYYQMGLAYLASGNLANAAAALRKATDLNPHHEQAQIKFSELIASTRNKELVEQAVGRLESVLSASPNNSEATDALALAEWKLGKTDEAISRLEETLRHFPSRLQTSVELARLKIAHKDFAAAEQVLIQAVASAPQSSPAELALGQLYMLGNEPAKAEEALRKAIQLDPQNGLALLGIASIQVAGKRMDEAEQTYRRLASLPGTEFKPLHALFLFGIGRRDAALAELEKLAKDAPNDRDARSRLVAAYRAMGKNKAAENLLEAALKKNPKDIDALLQRAQFFLQTGNVSGAATDLKQVLHFKPDSADAHLALAEVYKAQGMNMSVREEINEALRINPHLLRARLALARTMTTLNDARSALELLKATPADQKGTLGFVVERNWALLILGETKELRPVLDQALRSQRFPELLLQDALLRFQEGDPAGARTDAEEILQKTPEDVRALKLLADSYIAQKQLPKGEERLKTAAAAHPKSAPVLNLLGEWYINARNGAAARKAFDAAVSADPKFLPGIFHLTDLDYEEKHLDVARQRLQQVMAIDPKNIHAQLMLGTIAGDLRDREEAVRRYRAVLAIDGSNVMALNNLAYTLALSDPDEALKLAERATELAPDNATVEDTIGWVYYRKAVYNTAVHYLEAAVSKEPTPRRQFHLAMSYMKAGNRTLGEKTMLLALKQAPDLPKTEEGW